MRMSSIELMSMVRLAMAVAQADGRVADEELVAMSHELLTFGVSQGDAEVIVKGASNMTDVDALAIVNAMDQTKKKYVTGFLAVIIVADGDIEDKEIGMWSLISTLASLPTMTLGEALKFWKEN